MPTVVTENKTSLNPFKFLGVIICIFGLLFFLLALISCMGINRENLNLLRISLIGQFLTFIIFFIVAITLFFWNEKIRQRIVEGMITGLNSYYHIDEAWASFFDKLHISYFCCGKSISYSFFYEPLHSLSIKVSIHSTIGTRILIMHALLLIVNKALVKMIGIIEKKFFRAYF